MAKIIIERGSAILEAQCIPIDMDLLNVEHYREFLKARRQKIVKIINEYLGFSEDNKFT